VTDREGNGLQAMLGETDRLTFMEKEGSGINLAFRFGLRADGWELEPECKIYA